MIAGMNESLAFWMDKAGSLSTTKHGFGSAAPAFLRVALRWRWPLQSRASCFCLQKGSVFVFGLLKDFGDDAGQHYTNGLMWNPTIPGFQGMILVWSLSGKLKPSYVGVLL